MAKQILAQMGVVPKPARVKTQKKKAPTRQQKPARQQKPVRGQVVTPQAFAARIKAKLAR